MTDQLLHSVGVVRCSDREANSWAIRADNDTSGPGSPARRHWRGHRFSDPRKTTGNVHECRLGAALPRRGLASVIAWAVVCAVAAAVFYAVAAALQQHEAAQSAASSGMSLLVRLVRRPRWLAGVAATVVGAALHVVSLRLGPLALVQPVGVTGLLFALPLGAALHGHRLLRRDLGAAAIVIIGLVGLLPRCKCTRALRVFPSGPAACWQRRPACWPGLRHLSADVSVRLHAARCSRSLRGLRSGPRPRWFGWWRTRWASSVRYMRSSAGPPSH